MNTQLTLTEIMNCLGADMLPEKSVGSEASWIGAVEFLHDGAPIVSPPDTKVGMDIYTLMDDYGTQLAEKHEALAFYTVGWAAPNDGDDEMPPSLHPKRVRVAMLCLVTKDGQFGSAMRMYDNPEHTEMIVENNGRGQLRDSAVALWDDYK